MWNSYTWVGIGPGSWTSANSEHRFNLWSLISLCYLSKESGVTAYFFVLYNVLSFIEADKSRVWLYCNDRGGNAWHLESLFCSRKCSGLTCMLFQLKYGHAIRSAVGRADWRRASAPAQMTAWRWRTAVLTTRLCATVSRGCWHVGLSDFTGTQFLTARVRLFSYYSI